MLSFIELIQISLGTRNGFSVPKEEVDWSGLLETAKQQAIVGVLFTGVERVGKEYGISRDLLLPWFGLVNKLGSMNTLLDERAKNVAGVFDKAGFKSCVLKGQGTALLYPQPKRRQCGDIDIWVDGSRDEVLRFIQGKAHIGHIDVKHCDWHLFPDAEVEVHFVPTWFYNPFTQRRLDKWIDGQREQQFKNKSAQGFNTPTVSFNLVYSLIHIYRHLFDEGVGLRQLMDYYFILQHSTEEDRKEAYATINSFQMTRFAEAVMYVMKTVFLINDHYLLCPPATKDGKFLLNEIMLAGNFGHADSRIRHEHRGRWGTGWDNVKRNLRFLQYYPQEVCWLPAWKLWHWCWRKRKGYI